MDLEYDTERFSKVTGISAAGASAVGVGVAAFGPSAAMAIATTFGTASTGTAISTLSGAAATNAALAWLGGGALAAGGGGMAVGNTFLALAGPIGWGIGAISLGVGLFNINNKNKKAAEEAQRKALEVKQLTRKWQCGNILINNWINTTKITNDGIGELCERLSSISQYDYNYLSSEEKQELGILVNSLKSLSVLINKRIDGQTMMEVN